MRCRDRRWRSQARAGAGCALLFLALTLLLDRAAGTLTLPRALLWTALSAVLLAVLVPPRIRLAAGRLTVRGAWRERTVRADALVSVRQQEGVSAHLVLYDADGHHVQLDPRALAASPFLRHELETSVHRSQRAGTLREGGRLIARLSREADAEALRGM
ncbi:hypothetical protein [Streptomyces sp. NPDC096080]|uniref:hypothetical protein n=1 Tax=unclassified Streptomyces TaxID=2593676 RepID=UPI0033265838